VPIIRDAALAPIASAAAAAGVLLSTFTLAERFSAA